MKVTATDHMKYLDTMEAVDSDIMNKVLNAMEHYDYHRYTEADVRSALARDVLNLSLIHIYILSILLNRCLSLLNRSIEFAVQENQTRHYKGYYNKNEN